MEGGGGCEEGRKKTEQEGKTRGTKRDKSVRQGQEERYITKPRGKAHERCDKNIRQKREARIRSKG